jgi:hypothetical protein
MADKDYVVRLENVIKQILTHYKILSLDSLSLDVKYEFNSDNKRMYSGESGTIILDEGEIR